MRNFILAVGLVTAGLIWFGAANWLAVAGIAVIALAYLTTNGD